MKAQYEELKEDVLDEEKAIEETLERLYEVRHNFDYQKKIILQNQQWGLI